MTRKHNYLLAIILVIGVGAYTYITTTYPKKSAIFSNIIPSTNPTPTPMPFEELTIPYLRQRVYTSTLGSLERYAETSTYTSFLTTYQSDGLSIHGLLTQPKGTQPEIGWPAIVFIHGYIPPTLYKTTERYISYVDYLARNGFVVFKIDLRGHGESDGTPGGAYFSSDYIIDTLNAYAALETSGFVNPNKIGLWGHSMAGNITFRTLAVKPSIPVAVIWAGAVYSYIDQQKYGISDQSYRPPSFSTDLQNKRKKLIDTYGQPSAESQFWKLVMPTEYIADMKTAIQIHHAVNDDVVNIGYSRDLNALLNTTSVTHELYEYPNGGHNIEGNSFSTAMERTVEFYSKYLKNQ